MNPSAQPRGTAPRPALERAAWNHGTAPAHARGSPLAFFDESLELGSPGTHDAVTCQGQAHASHKIVSCIPRNRGGNVDGTDSRRHWFSACIQGLPREKALLPCWTDTGTDDHASHTFSQVLADNVGGRMLLPVAVHALDVVVVGAAPAVILVHLLCRRQRRRSSGALGRWRRPLAARAGILVGAVAFVTRCSRLTTSAWHRQAIESGKRVGGISSLQGARHAPGPKALATRSPVTRSPVSSPIPPSLSSPSSSPIPPLFLHPRSRLKHVRT